MTPHRKVAPALQLAAAFGLLNDEGPPNNSPQDFRAFLATFPPDHVFKTNDMNECPLACYAQDRTANAATDKEKIAGFFYDKDLTKADIDALSFEERWATKFAYAVDSLGDSVTAAKAIEIIDLIIQGINP